MTYAQNNFIVFGKETNYGHEEDTSSNSEKFYMNDNNPKTPGMRIRALRMKLGMTREMFCHQSGISVGTLVSWEVGRRNISKVYAMLLSHILINDFGVNPEKASMDMILYGKNKDSLD